MQLTRLRSPAVPGKLLSLSLRKIRRDTNLLDMERRLCKREEFCGFCHRSAPHDLTFKCIGALEIQVNLVKRFLQFNIKLLGVLPIITALISHNFHKCLVLLRWSRSLSPPFAALPPAHGVSFLLSRNPPFCRLPQLILFSTASLLPFSLHHRLVVRMGGAAPAAVVVKTRPVRERVLRSGLWSGQWKRRSEVTPSNFQRTIAGVYHNSV
jgi:hypothetical protein